MNAEASKQTRSYKEDEKAKVNIGITLKLALISVHAWITPIYIQNNIQDLDKNTFNIYTGKTQQAGAFIPISYGASFGCCTIGKTRGNEHCISAWDTSEIGGIWATKKNIFGGINAPATSVTSFLNIHKL